MLNHTYTSVKNANLVDCGKKQHIPSQPSPLLKENFLGEFRTELDKKKVLANLGIATSLSLEWEYIQGDIGRSKALMQELDSRTKYVTQVGDFKDKVISVIDGIKYLETIVGGEQEGEDEQNQRLTALEKEATTLSNKLEKLNKYLSDEVDIDLDRLDEALNEITEKVNNITGLIQVSNKAGNALRIVAESELAEGETPGLYVPDLSEPVAETAEKVGTLESEISTIKDSLDDFVTKEELGGDGFEFVNKGDYDAFVDSTNDRLSDLQTELGQTVKTGEDGHVDTLYVNKISKDNEGNIQITDSFEVTDGIPLDVRFVVKSLDELHALDPKVCYAGMGVIVSEQASLYILREPLEGLIDADYIKDEEGINWKCPEDLVIEVITQEDYDAKVEAGAINPHMFYYIHEEVVEEPLRKDFDSDEAYAEALNRWLRVLQQKYMSAVWGQEIESLVASKASNTAVKSLESEIKRLSDLINSLSGGTNEINIKDLNDQVIQNRTDIDTLITEGGTIPTIQQDLTNLQQTVTDDYVTKESIITDDPAVEYIFVKKTAFNEYTKAHDEAIATKVTTAEVDTEKIVLSEGEITSNGTDLFINEEKIALDKQVPVIEVMENSEFEKLTETDADKYYYVYDIEERYVLDSEFTDYKTSQNRTTTALSESVSNNKLAIGLLETLTTENKNTLVYAINELHTYISNISTNLDTLITGGGVISTIQDSIDALSKEVSTKYVTKESITKEDPTVEYIFLKKSDFDTYKTTHDAAVAKEVTTEKVTTDSVVLGSHTVTTDDSSLLFNQEAVALFSQLPLIEVLDSSSFESKDDINEDTYYMVYDTEERYVPDSEFTEYKTSQAQVVRNLSENITKQQTSIGDLLNLTTENKNTVVLAINELVAKIADLTNEVNALKEQLANSQPIE